MRRARGLTLTEALLAATLGSLVALMALGILPGALRGMAASAQELQAADLASEMLSRIESLSFGSIPKGHFDGRIPTPAQNAGKPNQFPPSPYPSVQRRYVEGNRERVVDYQISVDVDPGRDRAGVPAADLAQVKVRVDWKTVNAAGKSFPHDLEVTTMVGSGL